MGQGILECATGCVSSWSPIYVPATPATDNSRRSRTDPAGAGVYIGTNDLVPLFKYHLLKDRLLWVSSVSTRVDRSHWRGVMCDKRVTRKRRKLSTTFRTSAPRIRGIAVRLLLISCERLSSFDTSQKWAWRFHAPFILGLFHSVLQRMAKLGFGYYYRMQVYRSSPR